MRVRSGGDWEEGESEERGGDEEGERGGRGM